ncbi:MAG: TetR/AcrR family transcriptional regulator [Paludibacteraceae bacterium]|nr:TetR/AcrR family transcriptional regulator [Paludibacteraceae bacterium]
MEIGTRERIIEHAAGQFLSNGIRNITMDELAEQLGMSKRTIYELFKDKKELVMECMKYFEKEKAKFNQEILRSSENSFDALLNLFNANRDILLKTSRSFYDDIKKYFPEVSQYRECQKKNLKNLFNDIFQEAKEEGFVLESLDPAILSELFTEELFSFFDEKQLLQEKFRFKEFYETMYLTFFRGIATDKGRAVINNHTDNN